MMIVESNTDDIRSLGSYKEKVDNQITVFYGNQSFSHNSAKITVYALMPSSMGRVLKRTGLHHVVGGGPSDLIVAADKKRSGVYGNFYRKTFRAKENFFILVSVHQTVNGVMYSTGARLLRLRSTAALISLTANLPPSSMAQYEKICAFTGRADIVDINKPELYGIPKKVFMESLGKSFIKDEMSDEEELSELFEVKLFDGEKEPLGRIKKIITVKGEKIIADHRPLKRRIKV